MKALAWTLTFGALSVPAPAQQRDLTPYGRTCGPLLSGTVGLDGTHRRVQLDLKQGFPQAIGLTVYGDRPIEVPIPGTSCFLNTTLVGVGFFVTGASGGATHTQRVPYAAQLTVCVQDVVLRRNVSGGFDLESSNGLKVGPWFPVRSLVEDFRTTAQRDRGATSASWLGNGVVSTGRLGGSGILGDLDVRFGPKDTGQKDELDRRIYELDTDQASFPGSRTLLGRDVAVTNGVFEFRTLTLRKDEHLRFVGSRHPTIYVAGTARIEGVLSNAGTDALKTPSPVRGRPPLEGQKGWPGRAGGADGGKGGDSPHKAGSKDIHGSDGEVVQLPSGHPLRGREAGTGGRGSLANPMSGLDRDVCFTAYQTTICQQGASGGGGGGFVMAGAGGRCIDNVTGFRGHPPQPCDFGRASVGGLPLPGFTSLFGRLEDSRLLFLISGGGGGGGGAHPHGAFDERPRNMRWSPGGGGAAGGGPLHLRLGADLVVEQSGIVTVAGGDGPFYPYDVTDFWNIAPGGAGAGGSVLVQLGGKPTLRGGVHAIGGRAGRMRSRLNFDLRLDSLSGRGGDGYIRFEADPPIPLKDLTNLQPPATASNTARLKATPVDPVTTAGSRWYVTGFLPSVWRYYEVVARLGAQRVVFSDNPLISARRAELGQPVRFAIQGGRVDPNGRLLGEPTQWYETVHALNADSDRGNGFRFHVTLDRTRVSAGTPITIDSVRVVFDA